MNSDGAKSQTRDVHIKTYEEVTEFNALSVFFEEALLNEPQRSSANLIPDFSNHLHEAQK